MVNTEEMHPGQRPGEPLGFELENGCWLYSGSDEYNIGAYVRFCDPSGKEIVYWDSDEWADDPQLVMMAILRCITQPELLLSHKEGRPWS